jgi:hypothetical protein
MVGHAHDHSVATAYRSIRVRQQDHHALRRAGPQAALAQGESADILGLESIDILARIDAVDQRGRADAVRQRQLQENAVHIRISVQAVDQRDQFDLGGRRGQIEIERKKSNLLAGASLVAHIDRRRRVRADQDDSQSGRALASGNACLDPGCHTIEHIIRDAAAIQKSRSHWDSSSERALSHARVAVLKPDAEPLRLTTRKD